MSSLWWLLSYWPWLVAGAALLLGLGAWKRYKETLRSEGHAAAELEQQEQDDAARARAEADIAAVTATADDDLRQLLERQARAKRKWLMQDNGSAGDRTDA